MHMAGPGFPIPVAGRDTDPRLYGAGETRWDRLAWVDDATDPNLNANNFQWIQGNQLVRLKGLEIADESRGIDPILEMHRAAAYGLYKVGRTIGGMTPWWIGKPVKAIVSPVPIGRDTFIAEETIVRGLKEDGHHAYAKNAAPVGGVNETDLKTYEEALKLLRGDARIPILFKASQASLMHVMDAQTVHDLLTDRDLIVGPPPTAVYAGGEIQNQAAIDQHPVTRRQTYAAIISDIGRMSDTARYATETVNQTLDALLDRKAKFLELKGQYEVELQLFQGQMPDLKAMKEELLGMKAIQLRADLFADVSALPTKLNKAKTFELAVAQYRKVIDAIQAAGVLDDLAEIKKHVKTVKELEKGWVTYRELHHSLEAFKAIGKLIGEISSLRSDMASTKGDSLNYYEKHPERFIEIVKNLKNLVELGNLPEELAEFEENIPAFRAAILLRATACERIGRWIHHYFEDAPGAYGKDQRKFLEKQLKGLPLGTRSETYLMRAHTDYKFGEQIHKIAKKELEAKQRELELLFQKEAGILKDQAVAVPGDLSYEELTEEQREAWNANVHVAADVQDDLLDPDHRPPNPNALLLADRRADDMRRWVAWHNDFLADCTAGQDRLVREMQDNGNITSFGIDWLLRVTNGDEEARTRHAIGSYFYNNLKSPDGERMDPLKRYEDAMNHYEEAVEKALAYRPDNHHGRMPYDEVGPLDQHGQPIRAADALGKHNEDARRFRVSLKKASHFYTSAKAMSRILACVEDPRGTMGEKLDKYLLGTTSRKRPSTAVREWLLGQLNEAIKAEEAILYAKIAEFRALVDQDGAQKGGLASLLGDRNRHLVFNGQTTFQSGEILQPISPEEARWNAAFGMRSNLGYRLPQDYAYNRRWFTLWSSSIHNKTNLQQLRTWQARLLRSLGDVYDADAALKLAHEMKLLDNEPKGDYSDKYAIDWKKLDAVLDQLDADVDGPDSDDLVGIGKRSKGRKSYNYAYDQGGRRGLDGF